MPAFAGRTVVVLDDSGSMTWVKGKGAPSPIRIGAIFADRLIRDARSAGTNFHAIFQQAKRPYDRIVLLDFARNQLFF